MGVQTAAAATHAQVAGEMEGEPPPVAVAGVTASRPLCSRLSSAILSARGGGGGDGDDDGGL